MAYNKDNYENHNLTPKQEKFIDGILQGKTQYESYIEAYPKAKNWARNAVDSNASILMQNTKILQRLKEMGWKEQKKVEWTRKRALATINRVIELNNEDMERINNAYIRERQEQEAELVRLATLMTIEDIDKNAVIEKMRQVNERIVYLDKQPRVNKTNVAGILESAKVLNRMFGLDITKVEINNSDDERENMKSLSKEELKAIAYANINGGNSEKS